jgi:predicted nucleic acid-binding protein
VIVVADSSPIIFLAKVRRLAAAEGVRPIGTLGVLLRTVSRGHLRPTIARRDIDNLIRLHGFRIGIEVYQEVFRRLEQGSLTPRPSAAESPGRRGVRRRVPPAHVTASQ